MGASESQYTRKAGTRMSKRLLCLIAILFPFFACAQKSATTMERLSKVEINDDPAYSPKLARPAYAEAGPVVFVDQAHGNSHFFKAFEKLISADGYRVVTSRDPLNYEMLSQARVLVIMNPAVFMSLAWHQNPQPLFNDVEAAAVRDWVAAGGSLLFATGPKPEHSSEMLLSRLGVTVSAETLSDHELLPVPLAAHSATLHLVFSREKQMVGAHTIIAGRTESERVDLISLTNAVPILKAPDDALVLLHCSEKAVLTPRDWLLRKQELEAQAALAKSGATESQTLTMQSLTTPVPKVPVAVAFKLGKGRVIVVGNSSMLSSVTREFVLEGKPTSVKIGLGDGDNQKFTLNAMHWLSGLLE
jgi:hypothetical protein